MAAPTSAPLTTDDIFWADADRHLIRYAGAGAFTREIIDRAAGSFLFTEDGRRILDFTSGQMSAILGPLAPGDRRDRHAAGRPSSTTCSAACSAAPSSTSPRRLAETLPEPLEKVLLLTTGAESNEAAHPDGQARHRQTRDRLVRPVLARHDTGRRRRPPTAPGGKGYGPAAPGNFAMPAPDRYRPDFTTADGELDWQRRAGLRFRPGRRAVGRQPGRLHRRADPELRRHHRAAARLLRGVAGQVPGTRNAADPRRGPDRARAAPAPGTPSSATASCPTS